MRTLSESYRGPTGILPEFYWDSTGTYESYRNTMGILSGSYWSRTLMAKVSLRGASWFGTPQHKLTKTQYIFIASCTPGRADESDCITPLGNLLGSYGNPFGILSGSRRNIGILSERNGNPIGILLEPDPYGKGSPCKARRVLTLLNINGLGGSGGLHGLGKD